MTALPPDYDSDPERWKSWKPPEDIHTVIARELTGPVLDIGCGEGHLASLLDGVVWIGVDASPAQLADCPYRPAVLADMCALPFRDGAFAEAAHVFCLYHLDDPVAAVVEAHRVLRDGGHYFATTTARNSDPEIMWEGYPPSTFDAEDAVHIVSTAFDDVEPDRWDGVYFTLDTRDEVRRFVRHNLVPPERAETAELPLALTKRGVLVRARK